MITKPNCTLQRREEPMATRLSLCFTGAETTFLGSIYPLPPLSRDHRPEIASGTYYVKKSLYNQKKKMDAVGTPRVLLVPLARWGLLNQRAAPPRPVNKCRLGHPPPTTEYVRGGRLKYLILNRRSPLFQNVVSEKAVILAAFSKDCNASFGCTSLVETVGLRRLRKRCHSGWDMDQGFR